MAIQAPGTKFRHSRILSRKQGKREVAAVLSLTAMVDMFTVLVVFLLQNYNTTGEVLYIPKEVILPQATSIKELKPSVVVTISSKEILIDKTVIVTTDLVRAQEDWLIKPLALQLATALQQSKEKFERQIQNQLKAVVDNPNTDKSSATPDWNKVTIQSDKGMDFLMVKKVMYTVTAAGVGEINFAVTKEHAQK
jgi:biopolymer transport protein ExbD